MPAGLAALGLSINWYVPPSEYIMGGKDPGVYMNEGIQIAQRGTLTIVDDVVRTVPPQYRDLFFPQSRETGYYSNRFMGFFLLDPAKGSVVGQFPHLYPVWIAVAYGLDGLSGARRVGDVAAVLGLLAIYFFGARIAGRAAGTAAAALLAINVLQVWYARYPNAEIVMQPLVFGGLLAYTRAQSDGDRFFAPLAALLFVLAMFTHLTGVIAVVGVMVATLVGYFAGQRLRVGFVAPVAVGSAVALVYFARVLTPYFAFPVGLVGSQLSLPRLVLLGLVLLAAAVSLRRVSRSKIAGFVQTWWPPLLVVTVWLGAAYAYFLRQPAGALAPQDADALRTYTAFYFSPYGLAAALVGFLLLARWSPVGWPLTITLALFAFTFFYKIRIIPEHFWAGRRFLAVILPGSLLLVAAAAFQDLRSAHPRPAWLAGRGVTMARRTAGLLVLLLRLALSGGHPTDSSVCRICGTHPAARAARGHLRRR